MTPTCNQQEVVQEPDMVEAWIAEEPTDQSFVQQYRMEEAFSCS